ncbi:MAG: PilZ domain-containing protein [Desulfobacterales bacterium]|nr:MAG: PilZ domain-containing protein [Desulfobacterales bacterium]
MSAQTERRKFSRYQVPGGALYVFDHLSTRVGWINDISRGGLSFEYILGQDAEIEPEVIDIFSYRYDQFYLPAVSCKLIYAGRTADQSSTNGRLDTVHCGLQFGALSDEQSNKMDALIVDHLMPSA